MSRYSTILLCAFSTIFALPVFGQCNIGCDFIFNGSGGPYNLNGGKTLCIQSGTFTGSINFTGSGNTVCIASGATFNPNNLNNANGVTIQNYGTFIISQSFSFGAGTVIINHNIILQNANFNYNGPTQLINHANADWTINTNFVLQNGSSLTNDGVILANAEFTSNAGTTVINNNRIRIAKNFNPSGVFNNYGFLSATGFININSNSFVRNYCSLFSAEGFNNNSGNTQNYGLFG